MASFKKQIARYLTTRHPDSLVRLPRGIFTVRILPDEVLNELIEASLASAQRYGLTWQSSINAFVTLRFTVAPNFDTQPSIAAALAPDDRPPDFRMRDLPEAILPQDWEEAVSAYDPGAWIAAGARNAEPIR